MTLYSSADLSNGLELVAVRAVNQYTYDKIVPFEYIATTEIAPGCEEYFKPNEGCRCENCDDKLCDCYKDGESENDGGFRHMTFCDTDTCPCTSKSCGNHGTLFGNAKFNLSTALEVYFVNPTKKWGVRAKVRIPANTFVCEYAGTLIEDKDQHLEEDDYIFQFNFENRNYMVDAYERGNVGRFVNHSCSSNMTAIICVFGILKFPRIMFFTLKDIPAGEELTIDYGENWWTAKQDLKCACQAADCRYLKKHVENCESMEQ
ncbi:SET domain-containing protein [Ditylenchus destructor]|nr:SET domain-containing protein [Ditylenchus destructor]